MSFRMNPFLLPPKVGSEPEGRMNPYLDKFNIKEEPFNG
jgi:hypothetical protein